MSSETGITIISPKTLTEASDMAKTLAQAALLPEGLRAKPADVLLTIMTGAELGLGPTQSLRAIHIIKGKATLSAEAQVALVKGRRDVCQFFLLEESTPLKATYSTQRVGDPKPTTLSFTMDEAKAAGVAANDNYRRFPAAMLRARAASALCKAVYSDLLLGVYDPDELAPEYNAKPEAAATKVETIDTTATVAAVKAAVKAKRTLNVVDEPKADALPPPPPTPEPPPLTDADFVPTAVRP